MNNGVEYRVAAPGDRAEDGTSRLGVAVALAALLSALACVPLAFGAAAGQKYDFVAEWDVSNASSFGNPGGLSLDSDGDVYVTQPGGYHPTLDIDLPAKVTRYDTGGSILDDWETDDGAVGVDTTSYDAIGVAVPDQVKRYTNAGFSIGGYGSAGSGDGEFENARDVAFDSADNAYIVDSTQKRVQKFDDGGNFLLAFGIGVSVPIGGDNPAPLPDDVQDGEFVLPTAVAVGPDGSVYVADGVMNQIQRFDASGNFISRWGSVGSGDGELDGPAGLATDSDGDVYVADSKNDRVQIFDATGNFLTAFGTSGTGNGQFAAPFDLEVDAAGNVYVLDAQRSRVLEFAPGEIPVAPTGTVSIDGPSTLQLGTLGSFVANAKPAANSYRWDLDDDGSFETDTGNDPSVPVAFDRGGSNRIRVQAMFDSGPRVAQKVIQVLRPTQIGVTVDPVVAKPGQKVKLTLTTKADVGLEPFVYEWKIDGVKPKNSRVNLPGSKQQPERVISFPGSEATRKPVLKRTYPAKSSKRRRGGGGVVNHQVEVSAHVPGGNTISTTTTVQVASSDKAYKKYVNGLEKRFAGKVTPYDCDKGSGPYNVCASIGGPSLTGFDKEAPGLWHTIFSDTTPVTEICVPKLIDGGVTEAVIPEIQQQLDLPRPSDLSWDLSGYRFDPGAVQNPTSATTAGGDEATPSGPIKPGRVCTEVPSRAFSWNFGDPGGHPAGGPNLLTSPVGDGLQVVSHGYSREATNTVTMKAVVPFIIHTFQGKPESDEFQKCYSQGVASVTTGVEPCYFVAQKTKKVDVVPLTCFDDDKPGLILNGIPVTASGARPGKSCFIVIDTPQGKGYLPFPGYHLYLNGVRIQGEEVLAIPSKGKLLSQVGGTISGIASPDFEAPQSEYEVFRAQGELPIPNNKVIEDAAVTGAFASLPPRTLLGRGARIANLPVTSVATLLSPQKGQTKFLLGVVVPKPLQLGDPEVAVGFAGAGTQARNRKLLAGPGEDDKFSLDLSGTNVGLFGLKNFVLKLKANGAWQGGGLLTIPGLGGIDVTHKGRGDNPDAALCDDISGPSGIALKPDGTFDYGGATLKANPGLGPFGPLLIDCIGVSGATPEGNSPFQIKGKIGSHVGDIVEIDGCFLFSVLAPDDYLEGCEGKLKNGSAQTVWARAKGIVSVIGIGPLAQGAYDLQTRSDGTGIASFSGGLQRDLYVFFVEAGVNAKLLWGENTGVAGVDVGVYADYRMSACIDYGLDELCARGRMAMSTKGAAACADIIFEVGFVYIWGDGLDFNGCDFRAIELKASPASGGDPGANASAVQTVKVPKDLETSQFVISSRAGQPIPQITLPNDQVIADDGSGEVQFGRFDGQPIQLPPAGSDGRIWITPENRPKADYSFNPVRDPETKELTGDVVVSVDNPPAGNWIVDSIGAEIDGLRLQVPVTAPKIDVGATASLAKKKGKGKKGKGKGAGTRVFRYKAKKLAGRSITFYEQGDDIFRRVGSTSKSKGKVKVKADDSPKGKRTLIASFERDGIAVGSQTIAKYKHSGPPKVGKVKRLKGQVKAAGLKLKWKKAAEAVSYEVDVKTDYGRRIVMTANRPKLTIPGVPRSSKIVARVLPLGATGRKGKPAKLKLKAPKPGKVKLPL